MSIKVNLSEMLGRYKMTQKAFSEKTGIRPATASLMYHETIKRLELEHLDAMCKLFNCQPGDLLVYVPDKE
ncbi:MAG: helix-turn-helix transcriptional regulator [Thermacetogeniaceae bacterium]